MAFVGLAALILFAPRLISTNWGRRVAVSAINDRIKGQVALDQMDLTWLGPCRLQGVKVSDVQGRDVLQIDDLTYGNGLLMLMTSPAIFKEMTVEAPKATLFIDSEGKSSLAEALSPIKPSRKAISIPVPIGVAAINSGRLEVVNPEGHRYTIDDIHALVGCDALSRIEASVKFVPTNSGKVTGSFELSQFAGMDGVSLRGASGSFALATEGSVDLAPLATFLGQETLRGRISCEAKGELAHGKLNASAEARAQGIQSVKLPRETVRPIDITLSARVTTADQGASGSLDLRSQAGVIEGKFDYQVDPHDADIPPLSDAVADILSGRGSELPDFAFELSGNIDIPILARAVPALLRVLPDVEVSSGAVNIEDVLLTGGTEPSAKGRLALTGLQASRGQASIAPEPVEATLDVQLGEQTGLSVRNLALSSGFAQAAICGTVEDLSGQWNMDLAKFHQELGEIFDLTGLPPRGKLDGNLRLVGALKDQSQFDLGLDVTDLAYTVAGREVQISQASLNCDGLLLTERRRPVKAVFEQGRFQMGEDLSVAFSGDYSLRHRTFSWDVKAQRANINRIQELVVTQRPEDMTDLAGTVDFDVALSRQQEGGPILASGNASVTGLTADGKLVSTGDYQMQWSELRYLPDIRRLNIKSAKLRGEPLEVTAKDFELSLATEEAQASGELTLTADLAQCASAIAAFAEWRRQPQVRGSLQWQSQLTSAGGTTTASGKGSVSDLTLTSDGKEARLKSVQFAHKVAVDTTTRQARVEKLEMNTEPLRANAAGTVEDVGNQWILDLRGSYEGSWDRVMPFVYQFAPDLQDRFVLAGDTSGDFSVKGPARRPELRPTFRRVDAGTALGWQQVQFLGIQFAQANFSPQLSEGVLRIPLTVVQADGGKARLAGQVDFTRPQAAYVLPSRVMLLEDLPVTPQISRALLSRFNPAFAEMTSISGEISLLIEHLDLPLGRQITESGQGQGRLDLEKLKVEPEGLLAELLRFGFTDPSASRQMSVRGVDFVIRDGRVHYDEFALVFSEQFELEFRGSVGFDDTLDLAVSVPISAALLERFGIRGPVADYARVLDGVHIEIPLVGTRRNSSLDFAKVDIGALIQQAATILLSEQAGKIIGDILKVPESQQETPSTRPEDQVDLDDLLEPIFDLLKDRK